MAHRQTRRSVSLSRAAHEALVARAARENITAAELVTRALKLYGLELPAQAHRTRASAEHAAAAKIVAQHAPRVIRPKPLRLARGKAPKHNAIPTADDLAALLRQCRRGVANINSANATAREAAKRRVSIRFGHEMRKRGWITEEGYAPGSWADPANARAA